MVPKPGVKADPRSPVPGPSHLAGCLTGLLVALIAFRPPACRCDTRPHFTNVVQYGLRTDDGDRHSRPVDISRIRTFSFVIANHGPGPVVVQVELSPDGNLWDAFGEPEHLIEPGGKKLLVPQYFLHYARLRFRNAVPGRDTALTVWFQGQD